MDTACALKPVHPDKEISADSRKSYMNKTLELAEEILSDGIESEDGTHPIYLFIKILTDIITSNNLFELVTTHTVSSNPCYPFCKIVPACKDEEIFSRLPVDRENGRITLNDILDRASLIGINETVYLSYDPIVNKPWKTDSFTSVMSGVSFKGEFIQDSKNHEIETYLPYGISLVTNGYHSIAKGTLMSCGEIETNKIYCMNELHNYLIIYIQMVFIITERMTIVSMLLFIILFQQ